MARGRGRARQVLALQPARYHEPGAARLAGDASLAGRARLPRAKGRPRPRPLRGPLLPRLAPPRHARLARARLPHPLPGAARAARAARLLGRRLPNLQAQTAAPDAVPTRRTGPHLTEHY